MTRNLASFLTMPIVIIHIGIFYLWMAHWEVLVTEIGLVCWIGSILLGIGLYFWNRKLSANVFIKRLILISTTITILLAILALLIEVAINSMP